MKRLSVAAVAVGMVALFLASAALVSAPEGAKGVRADLDEVTANLGQLEKRIDKFRGELAQVSSARSQVPAEVRDLSARVERLSDRTAKLDKALAALAERPAGPAGATVEIDDAKMQELVRNAMRAQFERMRAGRGGQQGGQQRGGAPDMSAAGIGKRIGLDEEKAAKLAQIYKKRSDGIGDIWRNNRGGTREKNVALMRELQKKADEQVTGLVTAEQVKEFKKMQDEARRARTRDRGRRGRRGGQPAGGGATPHPGTTPGAEAF